MLGKYKLFFVERKIVKNVSANNPYNKYLKNLNVGGKEYKYYDISALDSSYGKCFII